jgi:hypothetical protein
VTIHITQPRKRKTPYVPPAPLPRVDPKHSVGWVYFAEAGGMIKIGHSRRLAKRLQVLRSSNPSGAKLLGVILVDRSAEGGIHERFHHLRQAGEWFTDAPELREFIAKNCDPTEARRAITREWAGVTRAQ